MSRREIDHNLGSIKSHKLISKGSPIPYNFFRFADLGMAMRPIAPLQCFHCNATVTALAAMLAILAAGGSRDVAAADQQTALPILSPCEQTAAPVLPMRWRAVGLMFPFIRQQLDVGEFVYDGSLPAMRATLYGLESGAIDLLITDKETYQLTGPQDSPDSCTAVGRKYSPPTSQWLSSEAICDGEAPVGPKKAQWWKTSATDGRTKWQWYATDKRVPWRMMFPSRSPDPAVIGDYGITYFPTFVPLAETKLARLRDLCVAKAQKPSAAAAATNTARELMAIGNDIAEAERAKRIQSLIPGLSQKACSSVSQQRWPHQFITTGILSPIPFKWTPLPSMIYYDWEGAATLFAYMYEARSVPPVLELVSVLTKGVGYSVERLPNGTFACAAKGPGAVRPDWMSIAGCECKGVLDHNPDLDPDNVSQIRACPVKSQGQRVNWSWYTTEGRPILFTEPGAVGTGLNIADYHRWLPGAKMPQDAFELPQLCTRAAEAGLPPVGNGLSGAPAVSCSDCHITQQ